MAVANIDDPSALAHLIGGALRISTEEKQELLEEVDVGARLRRLSGILARELEVVQLDAATGDGAIAELKREQPATAEVLANQRISGRDSRKDVRHLELSLEGSGLSYEPGDALGVFADNDAAVSFRIAAIFSALAARATMRVLGRGGIAAVSRAPCCTRRPARDRGRKRYEGAWLLVYSQADDLGRNLGLQLSRMEGHLLP